MALPVNVRDLLKTGSQLTAERDEPLRIAVIVEVDAPDALLVALEDALRPRTARVSVAIGVTGADAPVIDVGVDLVVALAGSGGSALAGTLAEAHRRGIPAVTLALAGVSTATAASLAQPLDDFIRGEDPVALVREDLAARTADHLPGKRLALAANFDFMRKAVANEYVKATAWQNALIGGVTIIPGADLPLMTGNQAKMVLQIAAAYGQPLDAERAKELLVVVGGGFAFRAVARQLLDFVPGFGWAIKAGVGYSGTIAMGRAAIAYFEQGADVGVVLASLGSTAEKGRRRLLTRRREPAPLPAPAAGTPLAVASDEVETADDRTRD